MKSVVNAVSRLLLLVFPKKEATFPQTRAFSRVFSSMRKAYAVEAYCGRFDDIPFQKDVNKLRDRHFGQFLELAERLLVYVGEEDRYYRQWLGLALLLADSELESLVKSMTYEEFQDLIEKQWLIDRRAVKQEWFEEFKKDMVAVALANHLGNLTTQSRSTCTCRLANVVSSAAC